MDVSNCVFVIDDPSHEKLDQREVHQYMTSQGADLLRIGPCSAPLNPMVQWANEALDQLDQEQCHAFTDTCEGRLAACILMQPLMS